MKIGDMMMISPKATPDQLDLRKESTAKLFRGLPVKIVFIDEFGWVGVDLGKNAPRELVDLGELFPLSRSNGNLFCRFIHKEALVPLESDEI